LIFFLPYHFKMTSLFKHSYKKIYALEYNVLRNKIKQLLF